MFTEEEYKSITEAIAKRYTSEEQEIDGFNWLMSILFSKGKDGWQVNSVDSITNVIAELTGAEKQQQHAQLIETNRKLAETVAPLEEVVEKFDTITTKLEETK